MKKIINFCLVIFVIFSCTEDGFNINNINQISTPTNISALVSITQNNTGLVTITPTGESVANFNITFGDGSENSDVINPGNNIEHVYEEGTYDLIITGTGLNGQTTSATQAIVVSFQAPQNLVVTIENDDAVSKQINVTATADFTMSYNVDFGDGSDLVTANIGDSISHVYTDAGTYTITVIAMGGAIETTTYTTDFEVTAILQPLASAPTPPSRLDTDVISIFTSAYTNVPDTNYFPDWGQGGQGSGWALFDLAGDEMLQYINLSYQGIVLADGTTVDVSGMEYLHLDVWTADVTTQLETSLINNASGTTTEAPIVSDLTANSWTSIEIPISDYTDQGLTVTEIFQLKFVGTPWAEGTVFIDNIYFYKTATGVVTSIIQDFEGTPPTFTTFGNIADIQVVANPDATGINTTANVVQLTKTNGAEVWAGTFFETSTPIDLSNYGKINIKTWSPNAGVVVKLKLENADGSITTELDLNTSAANTWEELVYDFSSAPTADYVRIVIFFDFGNAGDDSVYYYDEFELTN